MIREAISIVLISALITVGTVIARGLPATTSDAGVGAACSGPLPDRPAVSWIAPVVAAEMATSSTVFADARDQDEYESGHIPGAVHVPLEHGTLDSGRLVALKGYDTVVAYCDGAGKCARGVRLAGLLSATGFADVRVLEGGIAQWIAGGHPAESGECRQCP